MKDKKIQRIMIILSCVISTAMCYFFIIGVIPVLEGKTTKTFFAVVLLALIVLIVCVTYVTISKKNLNIYMVGGIILVCGIIYTIVFPPNTEPDGNAHWGNVLWLSNSYMDFSVEGRFPGRVEEIVNLTYDVARAPSQDLYIYRFGQGWIHADAQIIEDIGWWHFGEMIKYYPSVIGATIARYLNLGINAVMYIARSCNILFYSLVCMLSAHIYPKGKYAILMYSMIPMVSYIYSSLSYDMLSNAYLLLYFSLCMRVDSDDKVSWKYYLGAIITFLLITPFKGHYICFGLIISLLLLRKMCRIVKMRQMNRSMEKKPTISEKEIWKKRIKNTIVLSCGLVLIFCIVYFGKEYVYYYFSRIYADNYFTDSGKPAISLTYILKNVPEMCKMYFSSVVAQTPRMLYEMIGGMCYGQWLPAGLVLLFYLTFLLHALSYKATITKSKVVYMLTALLVYLIGFLGCMISYTAIGSEQISSVWGRYFLPILLLLLFIYSDCEKNESISKILLYAECIVCVISVCVVLNSFLMV